MEKIAIIDLGSNSARMSIFDECGTVLKAFRSPVRLSEGMISDMTLKPEPQMRAVRVLGEYRRIMEEEGVLKFRAVATAAVRKAKNRQEFLDLVKELTGIKISVIDGKIEAKLDCLAIERTLGLKGGVICDIGGGSTELIGLKEADEIPMVSIPYGSNAICEMFFKDGETPLNIKQAEEFAEREILANDWIAAFKNKTLVGIGGTIRALAKFDLEDFKDGAVQNYQVTPRHMSDIIKKVEDMEIEKRRNKAGIGERADIIMGGLVLLKAVLKAAQPEKIAVLDVGVREGAFYDLIENRGIL